MWKWLAENPGKRKDDYLLNVPPDQRPHPTYDCHLCDIWFSYAKCPGCPLSGNGYYCVVDGQPFRDYCDAEISEESKHALRLVEQCERWLEKHNIPL